VSTERTLLMKVGVALMALALALVVVAVVASAVLRGDAAWMTGAKTATAGSPDEPPQAVAASEPQLANSSPKPQPVGQQTSSGARSETESRPESEALLPGAEGGEWPAPTPQEIQEANNPRHYGGALSPGAIMALTIEEIGIYDAPVYDSMSSWALAQGIGHAPETSLPWSNTPQRNVFLAGHRMGFRGTWSRMIFYNLDELRGGERVVLEDREGRTYEYEVREVFVAEPTDVWVMGQVRGRDMVTLQTCTPIPTFNKRLIVRADRV
jgi:sortase A